MEIHLLLMLILSVSMSMGAKAVHWSTSCPLASPSYPCRCLNPMADMIELRCEGIDFPNPTYKLEEIFQHYWGSKISQLSFSESKMNSLPTRLIANLSVSTLILDRSNLTVNYEDNYPESTLAKSLHSLMIDHCYTAVDRWDWSVFESFKKLTSIDISDSSFSKLTRDFRAPSSVEHLTFKRVNLETIGDGSFSKLDKLRYLKISETPLKVFNRRALPERPEFLEILDLSKNKLEKIDHEDMFADLPALRVLDLKGNLLTTIHGLNNHPLISLQNTVLEIANNPFHCYVNMRWLLVVKRTIFNDNLEIFCDQPQHLKGSRVLNLDGNVFQPPLSRTYNVTPTENDTSTNEFTSKKEPLDLSLLK